MTARSRRLLTVFGAVAGSILFAYALRRAGAADILEGVRRVGWGLFIVFAAGGVRFLIRGECWRLCVPRSARLGLPRAWSAFLAGDAVGTVTPLGLLASEPTKVFLTRRHLATYGHAGDGNLHCNVLFDRAEERPAVDRAVAEILRAAVDLGGTITGEHGVGLAKRDFLEYEQGKAVVALERRLKDAFDPLGILNPGKAY